MQVAIVFNRDSKDVINLFGTPNREKIGRKTVRRILDALKKGGHDPIAIEGDKNLIDKLEDFMPRVLQGERPGMVFNVSYGIQGKARYTHVPSILEMVGIPYVGSGPLAHSLALDKVVSKMMFVQQGIPTPRFAVVEDLEEMSIDLNYPLIVKPKHEAVSFGLKIVNDESALREAAGVILREFNAPVLVEEYVPGREINVGILGHPPEALPPAEILFGDEGPAIYTYEDKTHRSGRTVQVACPAKLSEEQTRMAQDLAIRTFKTLGCSDCARVDMRMDEEGNLYVLELNSLPSLGEHGSFLQGAAEVGLDFDAVINRLVEVASARYFGTPQPPTLDVQTSDSAASIFSFLTGRRKRIERRIQETCRFGARTSDPIGLRELEREMARRLKDIGLRSAESHSDGRFVWTFATPRGFSDGTLLICPIDVPIESSDSQVMFRRDPEWLHGEGIGGSRAPLVVLEYALRAMKHAKKWRNARIGVLLYGDEGLDCRYSAEVIQRASGQSAQVLVLRPSNQERQLITRRQGLRRFRLEVEGRIQRLRVTRGKREGVVSWASDKILQINALTDESNRVAVAVSSIRTEGLPSRLPHRITAEILIGFPEVEAADRIESRMRELLGKTGPTWRLKLLSDRPPMIERKQSRKLFNRVREVASSMDISISAGSSEVPSVAGLIPSSIPVVCGFGPYAIQLDTPQEAVQRIGIVRRALLLARTLTALGD